LYWTRLTVGISNNLEYGYLQRAEELAELAEAYGVDWKQAPIAEAIRVGINNVSKINSGSVNRAEGLIDFVRVHKIDVDWTSELMIQAFAKNIEYGLMNGNLDAAEALIKFAKAHDIDWKQALTIEATTKNINSELMKGNLDVAEDLIKLAEAHNIDWKQASTTEAISVGVRSALEHHDSNTAEALVKFAQAHGIDLNLLFSRAFADIVTDTTYHGSSDFRYEEK